MSKKNRVILQAGDVKVDAEPGVLASMFHNLINNKKYREAFEQDPVAFLAKCGIDVPEKMGKKITAKNIDAAIEQLTEGGPERGVAALVAPGVAPAIRVGTRPGTRPGVRVGVRVVTGTRAFASVKPSKEKDW